MARMSIDDSFKRDTRLDDLAELVGWTRRETAGCLQMDVWPLCYDRVTPNIRARDIDIAANREAVTPVKHPGGFSAALVEAGLGRPATKQDAYYLWTKNDGSEMKLPWRDPEWRDRVYIVGAPERIAYLLKREESGKAGGTKSAEVRRNKAKHSSSTASSSASTTASSSASTLSNPSASASAPDSASALVTASDSDSDTLAAVGPASISKPRSRKAKPSEPTDSERASAMRVLSRLGQRNGVAYTGGAEHVRLIVNQLRSGVSELELRAIGGYCQESLGWGTDKPEMGKYLTPETLYGPKTISRYLDPARTWAADAIADAQRQQREAAPPALELVP